MKTILAFTILVSSLAVAASEVSNGKPYAPHFDGLGDLHHLVTTASKKAQRYFDQGLTLCYAFNHKEAIRSFQAATKHDSHCAMAYWGIAYALGPHVNK